MSKKGSRDKADKPLDDPRRPNEEAKFDLSLPPEERPQDFMILLAFLCGFIGLIFKVLVAPEWHKFNVAI